MTALSCGTRPGPVLCAGSVRREAPPHGEKLPRSCGAGAGGGPPRPHARAPGRDPGSAGSRRSLIDGAPEDSQTVSRYALIRRLPHGWEFHARSSRQAPDSAHQAGAHATAASTRSSLGRPGRFWQARIARPGLDRTGETPGTETSRSRASPSRMPAARSGRLREILADEQGRAESAWWASCRRASKRIVCVRSTRGPGIRIHRRTCDGPVSPLRRYGNTDIPTADYGCAKTSAAKGMPLLALNGVS